MPVVASCPESGFDIHALESLFADHGPRLAHMRDAASFAGDIAGSFSLSVEPAQLLIRSALLHDIGYAPVLRRFEYHALDGALFLEENGEHPWVVEGVLRHSQADRKGGRLPAVSEHYARRPPLPEADWLVRAVTVADWRAAGVGKRVSFARRFEDIAVRNADNPEKVRLAAIMVQEVRDWFLQWAQDMATERRPLPWVFCDVDNTLIRPGDRLSASNKAAVKAYVAAGGVFSLATGKHPLSIAPLVLELGLETIQVAGNGSCLLDKNGITVLDELGDSADALRAALQSRGLPIAIYRPLGIETGGMWPASLDEIFDHYGEIRPASTPLPGPALKILCIVDGDDLRREDELRLLASELGVDCCRSDRHFLEFLPKHGNKGQAARTVMEQAEWPVLHSLAVGDTENDEPLFALCGACAAVGNAGQWARRGADWTIGQCADNGVGGFLDRLRLGHGWAGLRSGLIF
jgi:hydroxymethylpyrimidine pyrophosphatase-like HAD family hydrolase